MYYRVTDLLDVDSAREGDILACVSFRLSSCLVIASIQDFSDIPGRLARRSTDSMP
jgi:hypothetical protein